ncbi:transporter substrate-binding domain-containing protein [Pseudorhodobacter sp.]|uniref:transporter substrate-binding domain-containing protein n=1 Tax=Pseudorhodobacter sp. TaxID=1934400 RepID=UPI002647C2D8|nr:transporter substrate-binding domain-containing protein [Pseudorhodobacter sp.]MDN5787985.1 transporter substrate-binding domain-containing protein [Pseudorhodobacter sp.]
MSNVHIFHRLGSKFLLVAFFLSIASALAAQEAERNVAVGLYVSPPFVMTDDAGTLTGMAVDLWEKLAETLQLQSNYTYFDSPKDLVAATARGDVDVAVTNMTITKKRAESVSFTQPWFDAGQRIMVAEGQSHGVGAVWQGLSSAGHLRTYGWMLLIVLAATIGITLFDRHFDPKYPKRWRDGLAEGLYTVMSVATSGRPPSRSNLFGWVGRLWAAIWLVCGIGVLAYITSSVTSVMTTLAITGSINGPADLPGKTIGVFAGSVSEDFAETFGLHSRSYHGIDEAVAALKAGRVDAVIADAPVLEYYAHIHPEQNLSVVGEIFEPDKYGFAMPLDGDLRKPITIALLGLKEAGIVDELRRQYFGDRW